MTTEAPTAQVGMPAVQTAETPGVATLAETLWWMRMETGPFSEKGGQIWVLWFCAETLCEIG